MPYANSPAPAATCPSATKTTEQAPKMSLAANGIVAKIPGYSAQ
ncbi:MAG: hypothetical protein ACXW00_12095 [Methylobacter sp.]